MAQNSFLCKSGRQNQCFKNIWQILNLSRVKIKTADNVQQIEDLYFPSLRDLKNFKSFKLTDEDVANFMVT